MRDVWCSLFLLLVLAERLVLVLSTNDPGSGSSLVLSESDDIKGHYPGLLGKRNASRAPKISCTAKKRTFILHSPLHKVKVCLNDDHSDAGSFRHFYHFMTTPSVGGFSVRLQLATVLPSFAHCMRLTSS